MSTRQEQVPERPGRPDLRLVDSGADSEDELGTRHSALGTAESVGVPPTRSGRARARGSAELDRVPSTDGDGQGAAAVVESADDVLPDEVSAPEAEPGLPGAGVPGRVVSRLRRAAAAVRAVLASRLRDRAAWARLGRVFIPPKLITEQRPSLREQWHYARWGEHLPRHGVWRGLAIVYGLLVSLPTSCVAYLYEWVWERPSRAVATFLLFGVLAQVPYVRPVLGVVGTVATFPITVWF